jgi:hypothetical protein
LPRVKPSYSERHASSVHDLRYANRPIIALVSGPRQARPSFDTSG